MAKITFYVPDQPPAKYGLGDEVEVTIGRSPDCDITLDHPSISGNHAIIRQIGHGLHGVIDQGSTNGTFVEGSQITEAPLSPGSSVMFGSVPAEYEAEDETAAPQEEAPAQEESAPAEEPAAESGFSESSGGGVHSEFGSPIAEVGTESSRPQGFKDLSPVEKVEKKDSISKIALMAGIVAVVAVLALAVSVLLMTNG
ncbi:MAG: FHA domain-containing protein [Verrucomicrobiota bacterium]